MRAIPSAKVKRAAALAAFFSLFFSAPLFAQETIIDGATLSRKLDQLEKQLKESEEREKKILEKQEQIIEEIVKTRKWTTSRC